MRRFGILGLVRFRHGPPRNIKTTFGWFFHSPSPSFL